MENSRLQRGLKSRHISLIALGGIIGSAYFLGTGYIVHTIGPGAFLAYILGGIITFLTLACLAELEVAIASKGSFIGYASSFISPSWACGMGWSYWMTWVVYIPSECLAGGIVMHHFFPHVPAYLWAFGFGLIITIVNLSNVRYFGELEFWFSLVKIIALVGFSVLAILIFFGLIGTGGHQPIGTEYLLGEGGLFPNGTAILLVNMVLLLVNYQGSEIIGLSAAESVNPSVAVPASLKKVALRIFFLYLIPIFLLALIFPWQEANLSGSVFGRALGKYGFFYSDVFFNIIIVVAALSCSNSGLYATVRALYGLSEHKMAPKIFGKLNQQGVPIWSTLATLGVIWTMLIFSYFFSSHQLYTNFLAISGFTGAICWISICWSQLRFRRLMEKRGESKKSLIYAIPLFPYLTHLGIWLQVVSLGVVILNPDLRSSLYFGLPILLIPMCIYKLRSQ